MPKELKQRMQDYFQTMWSLNHGIDIYEVIFCQHRTRTVWQNKNILYAIKVPAVCGRAFVHIGGERHRNIHISTLCKLRGMNSLFYVYSDLVWFFLPV